MTSKGRNKTLCLSKTQIEFYAKQALTLKERVSAEHVENKIIMQDTLRALDFLPDSCVDLMVVDPPYNLTKQFSGKAFKEMDSLSYQNWLDMWLSKVGRILKDNASIYICSDWKTSIDIPQIAGKYFILQNRISWEREKGRGAQKNWKNCLEDIWFYTKSSNYTFNLDAVKVMRPVIAPYKDETGKAKDWKVNEKGQKFRLTAPSNIWTDISVPFAASSAVIPGNTQTAPFLFGSLLRILSVKQKGNKTI